ncbi:MAG: hypothetical protein ACLGGV_01755 [Bacteroidia bacterium]
MSRLTYGQKLAFAETVAELLAQNQDAFSRAGLETADRLAGLQNKNQTATAADAAQEKLKADLVKATQEAVAALNDSYLFASSTLDAMVGVLGKDTPLAKRLRKLREQMTQATTRGKRDENQPDT